MNNVDKIEELIKRRRLQIMLHSVLYYYYGGSIISDQQFDRWAYELLDLQNKYPLESKKAPHYDLFSDWDASSGFDLQIPGEMYYRARCVKRYHDKNLKFQ